MAGVFLVVFFTRAKEELTKTLLFLSFFSTFCPTDDGEENAEEEKGRDQEEEANDDDDDDDDDDDEKENEESAASFAAGGFRPFLTAEADDDFLPNAALF